MKVIIIDWMFVSTPNSNVEAWTTPLHTCVALFGDGAPEEVIRLNEAIRVAL